MPPPTQLVKALLSTEGQTPDSGQAAKSANRERHHASTANHRQERFFSQQTESLTPASGSLPLTQEPADCQPRPTVSRKLSFCATKILADLITAKRLLERRCRQGSCVIRACRRPSKNFLVVVEFFWGVAGHVVPVTRLTVAGHPLSDRPGGTECISRSGTASRGVVWLTAGRGGAK